MSRDYIINGLCAGITTVTFHCDYRHLFYLLYSYNQFLSTFLSFILAQELVKDSMDISDIIRPAIAAESQSKTAVENDTIVHVYYSSGNQGLNSNRQPDNREMPC